MMKTFASLIVPLLVQAAEVPTVSLEGIPVQLKMAKLDVIDLLQKRFVVRKMQSVGDMWCLKSHKDKSDAACSTPGGYLIFHGGRLNQVSKHYGDDPDALLALVKAFQGEGKVRSNTPFRTVDMPVPEGLHLSTVSFTFGGKEYGIEVTLKNNAATSFIITETLRPSTAETK
jgi:hypothetical protein